METNTVVHDPPRTGLNKKGRRRDIFFLFLFAVAVAFLVRIIFDYSQKIETLEREKALKEELSQAYYQLDTIEEELEKKIVQITELGGRVNTLVDAKEQLLQEKENIRKKNTVVIQDLKERVEGYTRLLLEKDKEVANLKRVNEILLSENVDLKKEATNLQVSLHDLHEKQRNLEEKIHHASALKAEHITVVGLKKSGKALRKLRASRIKTLRISFSVPENKLALLGTQTVYLRVITPKKEALFDVQAGGGSFSYKGKDTFYTLKEEFFFKRKRIDLAFDYIPRDRLLPGVYTVEIYTEDAFMGKESFKIRK